MRDRFGQTSVSNNMTLENDSRVMASGIPSGERVWNNVDVLDDSRAHMGLMYYGATHTPAQLSLLHGIMNSYNNIRTLDNAHSRLGGHYDWPRPNDEDHSTEFAQVYQDSQLAAGQPLVKDLSGGQTVYNNTKLSENSRAALGPLFSGTIEEQMARVRIMPLLPSLVFNNIRMAGKARALLGMDVLELSYSGNAFEPDSALSATVVFNNITVEGDHARWDFAVDVSPEWDPRYRPGLKTFLSLPSCNFKNITIKGRGKVELGSTIYVNSPRGVLAVTSQDPGHAFNNIDVLESARLRTSLFTAGAPNGPALQVFELLQQEFMPNLARPTVRAEEQAAAGAERWICDTRYSHSIPRPRRSSLSILTFPRSFEMKSISHACT